MGLGGEKNFASYGSKLLSFFLIFLFWGCDDIFCIVKTHLSRNGTSDVPPSSLLVWTE